MAGDFNASCLEMQSIQIKGAKVFCRAKSPKVYITWD